MDSILLGILLYSAKMLVTLTYIVASPRVWYVSLLIVICTYENNKKLVDFLKIMKIIDLLLCQWVIALYLGLTRTHIIKGIFLFNHV